MAIKIDGFTVLTGDEYHKVGGYGFTPASIGQDTMTSRLFSQNQKTISSIYYTGTSTDIVVSRITLQNCTREDYNKVLLISQTGGNLSVRLSQNSTMSNGKQLIIELNGPLMTPAYSSSTGDLEIRWYSQYQDKINSKYFVNAGVNEIEILLDNPSQNFNLTPDVNVYKTGTALYARFNNPSSSHTIDNELASHEVLTFGYEYGASTFTLNAFPILRPGDTTPFLLTLINDKNSEITIGWAPVITWKNGDLPEPLAAGTTRTFMFYYDGNSFYGIEIGEF